MKPKKYISLTVMYTALCILSSNAYNAYGTDNSVQINPSLKGKRQISMVVTEIGRNNPFEPVFGGYDEDTNFYLEPPPEMPGLDNDALDVIKTRVSGIIFNKNKIKSSAILNVGGVDYLTRIGDTINGYIVKDIDKDNITVQLGMNVFKASVGDIIEKTNLYDVNKTQTPNLESKFAGRKK